MEFESLQAFYDLFLRWRFHVPDYQRGYAWDKDQWNDLLDDIASLTDENEHFTGLLVLHENHEQALAVKSSGIIKPVFDIVDGQQRLTTIVILLNEIRNEILRLGNIDDLPSIADGIKNTFLYEPSAGNQLSPKLILDINNHDFFTHNILDLNSKNLQGALIQSHKNLKEAKQHFHSYLRSKQDELGNGYSSWLEHLYDKIANKLKVMVFRLRTEADAGVVFESMNNRGKKPTNLDLVKNYILYLASKLNIEDNQELIQEINRTWRIIFELLSTRDLAMEEDNLLQMHWMAIYDYDRRHWNSEEGKANIIKKRFRLNDYINKFDDLYKELVSYVSTLKNSVVAFSDIFCPKHSNAFQSFANDPALRTEVIRCGEKLNRLGIMRPFIPLLISIRLSFQEDANKYLEALRLCEKYAFRVFKVAGRRSSTPEAFLFRMANQLYHKKLSFSEVIANIQSDLLEKCSDEIFAKRFSLDEGVPWYQHSPTMVQYFLYEYEEYLFKPYQPIINWDEIFKGGEKSIEHILPQGPEENSYWTEHFSVDERNKYTHILGNLTLVLAKDNSSLGRKEFSLKKGKPGQKETCYANSDLRVEREIAGIEDWSPQEIEKRQQRLAKWASERWHVEKPALAEVAQEKYSDERILLLAKEYGVQKEYQTLIDLAQKHNLHLRPWKTCMVIAPPNNKSVALFTIWPKEGYLDVGVWFKKFQKMLGVLEEHMKRYFAEEWNEVTSAKLSSFIVKLEQALSEAQAQVPEN